MIRKKEKITIIVDDREVPSGVLSVIGKMEDVTVEVKRIPLGDYVIDDRLLVERKTIQDLAISIRMAVCSGRHVDLLIHLCGQQSFWREPAAI